MIGEIKSIGKYSIEHEVAQSNYAQISKVKDADGKCFILKRARKPKSDMNELISREYQILSQFQHPNIVSVFDYDVWNDKAYFILEYIDGKRISQYFKEVSGELYNAVAQILNALGVFHSKGFIHGDITPDNILYDSYTRRAVLIDFGFAGLPYQSQRRGGTIGYIAPEIMNGERGDQRSDLYSLGVILYEIATGKKFDGSIAKEDVKVIPTDIGVMLERVLSTEPSVRPTAMEMFRGLESYVDEVEKMPSFEVTLPSLVYMKIPEIHEKLKEPSGRMHIVFGEVGLGKTRMLHELKAVFINQGHSIIYYSPRELTGFREHLRNVIGYDIQDSEKDDRFQLFEEITERLVEYARHKKVMILIDDLNELQDSDLDLVRYIGHGLQGTNISIIGCSVSDDRIRRLGFEIFYLRPLSVQEIESLLERTFCHIVSMKVERTSPTLDLAEWLNKQSGGNLLLVEYLLKALYQQRVLVYEDYAWRIDINTLDSIHIPAELKGLLEKQLAYLSTRERNILKVLSLITHPLEPFIINGVLEARCDVEIERVKGRGIIKESAINGKRIILFSNQILKTFVSEELEADERQYLLERMISIVEKTVRNDSTYAPVITELYDHIGDREHAYPFLKMCAKDAEKQYDYDAALSYYYRLLEYEGLTSSSHYAESLVKTAQIEHVRGNANRAIELFNKARDVSEKPLASSISGELGKVYASIGEYSEAAHCFKDAMMQPKNRDTQDYLKVSVYSLMYLKQHENIRTILDQPFLSSRHVDDAAQLAETRYYQSIYEWLKGDLKKAIAKAQENLRFTEKHQLTRQSAYIETLLCFLFHEQGVLDKARTMIQNAIDKFKKMKLPVAWAQACYRLAGVCQCEGNFPKAQEIMNEVVIAAQQTDNSVLYCSALADLAYVAECRGDFSQAMQLYRRALDLHQNELFMMYRLGMVLYKMNDIEQLETLMQSATEYQNECTYFFITAMIKLVRSDNKHAIEALRKGMKVINLDDFSGSSRATLLLQIAQLLIDTQQYEDGMDYSLAVIKSSHTQSREYALACILRKICSYMIEKSSSIDITTEIDILKKMGCMYDYILAQRARIVAEMESDIKMVNIRKTADDLQNMYVAAQSINAYREIQQIEKIRAHLFPAVIDEYSKQSISAKYLTTFSRLADLIHEHLGDEDFVHNVLDVIIESTHAERGALFMKTGAGSMKFMVGRNMDQTSIEGAHELSLTALKEMKNDNLILTDNALDDPELSTKKSVVINQIRSLLCIALSVGSHVVGALYLDSRLGSGHFGPEDKAFLLTVSKILASVIEKSKFFHGLAEENILLKAKMIEEIGAGYVLGRSQQMKKIYQLVDNVAPANLPVLIQGETGTGKGMLARLIHQKSQRKEKKFLTINCGAIPETLLESELFGHKKGAFTGAMYDKKGLLEEGEGGTVFLDEVANTSPAFQAKLLEAIEEKKIRRLGETMTRSIDVRFFFATNRDLEHETKEGRFRKDLYYRINVFKIELPPLRERKKDIPELAQFFLERFSHELNKPIKGFSPDAIQSMQEHKWPGNVRELQNAIERAVVLTQNDYIMTEDFGAQGSMVKDVYGAGSIDETKKKVILEALNRHKWNVKKTAQELGIGRVTLWRFMKKHGISRT